MTTRLFKHYSDVPKDFWRWKDFSPRELASKREGELLVNTAALDMLQALRDKVGRPMLITSAYRSPAHNRAVGGAKNSKHMKAEAFDVQMANHDPAQFEAAARAVGFKGFGFYPRSGFMHIDMGPGREWGKRWPKTEVALATEVRPEPAPTQTLDWWGKLLAGGGTAVAGVGTALGDLDPLAQNIAIGGVVVILGALVILPLFRGR